MGRETRGEKLRDIAVVGASVAGVSAINELRRLGHEGRIVLIGAEEHAPYTRPPLSKSVLRGIDEPGELALPQLDNQVELRLGAEAAALSMDEKMLTTADGERIQYDGLVIATGARARRLRPGTDDEIVLRTIDDCVSLRKELGDASDVLLVGGGFLGMEMASAAADLGKRVTVVDMQPPLLSHMGPYLSQSLIDGARSVGVEIVVSEGGVELLGSRRPSAVKLADGRIIGADLVISAVGCEPNVEWLESSGVEISGGLHVDHLCRVSPDVVGAGDVVRVARPTGVERRTPVWMNAVDQGRLAANALLLGDDAKATNAVPFFWTEAFGVSLRVAGPLPLAGPPNEAPPDMDEGSQLLRWSNPVGSDTVVAVNQKVPAPKLRSMVASPSPATAVESA